MKKYLFIVIPIIILIVAVIVFIGIYLKKKKDTYSHINNAINEVSQTETEPVNTVVDEINESTNNLINDDEIIEIPKQENNEVKKNTSSSKTTSQSSTTKNTSSKTTSSKSETKVEEKKEETTTQSSQTSTGTQKDTAPSTESKIEVVQEPIIERCTNKDNHAMGVGNTGKWFSTKDEAIAYYKSEIKYWGTWWESTEADDTEADETYYKNCPSGYEIWSCMYCGKWTINYYYR